jgi:hypothetical protein
MPVKRSACQLLVAMTGFAECNCAYCLQILEKDLQAEVTDPGGRNSEAQLERETDHALEVTDAPENGLTNVPKPEPTPKAEAQPQPQPQLKVEPDLETLQHQVEPCKHAEETTLIASGEAIDATLTTLHPQNRKGTGAQQHGWGKWLGNLANKLITGIAAAAKACTTCLKGLAARAGAWLRRGRR